jgi:hypothetical protein
MIAWSDAKICLPEIEEIFTYFLRYYPSLMNNCTSFQIVSQSKVYLRSIKLWYFPSPGQWYSDETITCNVLFQIVTNQRVSEAQFLCTRYLLVVYDNSYNNSVAAQYLKTIADQDLKAAQSLYDNLHCKDGKICIDQIKRSIIINLQLIRECW